jgi:3-deoxy-7-phosphoheptulonate synthase
MNEDILKRPQLDTIPVNVGGVLVGGDSTVLYAGTCLTESRDNAFWSYRLVKEVSDFYGFSAIVKIGWRKWRSNPNSHRGFGEDALKWASEARETYGLPFVTEVIDPRDVELVAKYADGLQIGVVSSSNIPLLEAAAKTGLPVFYKRARNHGLMEAQLWISYITNLRDGNPKLVLFERSGDGSNEVTRGVLDVQAVPTLKKITSAPIGLDAMHGAGHRDLVPHNIGHALISGADIVLVEMHPDPDKALCDGLQSIDEATFRECAELINDLQPIKKRVKIIVRDQRKRLEERKSDSLQPTIISSISPYSLGV